EGRGPNYQRSRAPREARARPTAAGQARGRSYERGYSSWPRGRASKIASVPGPWSSGGPDHWRFHRNDWRTERTFGHSSAAHAQGSDGERADLSGPGIQDSRSGKNGDGLQWRLVSVDVVRRRSSTEQPGHPPANVAARGFSNADRQTTPDPRARNSVPDHAGLGLRHGACRRRARGDASALCHFSRSRFSTGRKAGAAGRPDDAVARGTRWRQENEQEPRE